MTRNIYIFMIITCWFSSLLLGQEQRVIMFGPSITIKSDNQVFEYPEEGVGESIVNFEAGLHFYHAFNERLRVSMGITYAKYGINQIDYHIHFPCGETPVEDPFAFWTEDEFSIEYFGIPATVQYLFYREKLYATIGTQLRFKGDHSEASVFRGCFMDVHQENKFTQFNDFLFEGKIGLGYQFTFLKERTIYTEMQILHTVNNIFKHSGIINNSRFVSYGMTLGFIL